MTALLDLGLHALRNAYRAGTLDVRQVIEEVLKRIAAARRRQGLDHRACPTRRCGRGPRSSTRGAARSGRLPLYGVPFAVKDNIDVAGMPTTAACPAFAYRREQSRRRSCSGWSRPAPSSIGKTNLDQFATGLVGVRSPYGVPRNPVRSRATFRAARAPARRSPSRAGLVSFALGTDTAGSGRVPAAFNNIVGLKPTRGLLSTRASCRPAARSTASRSSRSPAPMPTRC